MMKRKQFDFKKIEDIDYRNNTKTPVDIIIYQEDKTLIIEIEGIHQ